MIEVKHPDGTIAVMSEDEYRRIYIRQRRARGASSEETGEDLVEMRPAPRTTAWLQAKAAAEDNGQVSEDPETDSLIAALFMASRGISMSSPKWQLVRHRIQAVFGVPLVHIHAAIENHPGLFAKNGEGNTTKRVLTRRGEKKLAGFKRNRGYHAKFRELKESLTAAAV